ncbi:hypothetical protein RRG08_018085 [Elysia crispata]|uniref:Ribosomal protein eL8/eL30/eS12/Gadd45 domain-containing protein n=1 Tax=Elysia crispata TaxID=231223 RepID=A0AAE0ZDH9_9GAST|nr:hypothetical protein RRG08_018085 [Elysia crispata]
MDRISGKCLSIRLRQLEPRRPARYIYNTLKEVVWQAVEQGRVTCGVQNCAQQLETEPSEFPLCVLLAATPGHIDIPTSIHHMLIEAFCLEHSVQLIKVDSVCKLGELLQGRSFSYLNKEFPFLDKTLDLGCVILQYPAGKASEEDRALTEFCRTDLILSPALQNRTIQYIIVCGELSESLVATQKFQSFLLLTEPAILSGSR